MLTDIVQYIFLHWAEWLFLAISALLGWGYRQLTKRMKVEAERNTALHEGMQALLRDRIIQAYNHYQDKQYCPDLRQRECEADV